jgi:hypothetical protein
MIPFGPAPGVGTGNSVMIPHGVIRPTLFAAFSQNHRFPSGPSMIPIGRASGVGVGNSTKRPLAGSNRPIREARLSQNQRPPSTSRDEIGPAVGRRNLVQNDLGIR